MPSWKYTSSFREASIMVSQYQQEKERYEKYLQSTGRRTGRQEEIRTTPLLSLQAKYAVDSKVIPQYGLLGHHIGDEDRIGAREPILLNMNAPNSAFICGSQGSGKSYTLTCMLENCLMNNKDTTKLTSPVAGVVFHYDQDSSAVAEAAHLRSRGIKVNVLVTRSSAATDISERYLNLPGPKEKMTIQTLMLQDRHLSVERMLKLMAFSESEGSVPLYMEVIQRILREIAISGKKFQFDAFLQRIKKERFQPAQEVTMNMRLALLKSFMATKGTVETKVDCFQLRPGELTIVDLSDPLMDQASACILFDICLALFKENRPKSGLVVTLDEAHK